MKNKVGYNEPKLRSYSTYTYFLSLVSPAVPNYDDMPEDLRRAKEAMLEEAKDIRQRAVSAKKASEEILEAKKRLYKEMLSIPSVKDYLRAKTNERNQARDRQAIRNPKRRRKVRDTIIQNQLVPAIQALKDLCGLETCVLIQNTERPLMGVLQGTQKAHEWPLARETLKSFTAYLLDNRETLDENEFVEEQTIGDASLEDMRKRVRQAIYAKYNAIANERRVPWTEWKRHGGRITTKIGQELEWRVGNEPKPLKNPAEMNAAELRYYMKNMVNSRFVKIMPYHIDPTEHLHLGV